MTYADAPPRDSVGFVGLGNMGGPMARRLAEAGYRVRGYDLAASARLALGECGGVPVPSLAEAVAEVNVIILMLPDSNAVEAVLTSASVLDSLEPGAIIVDMSSSEPERTRALARMLTDRNSSLVDAPVSGGVRRATTGELAIMVGGREEDMARVQPLLSVLGRTYRAGPVGAGHAVKALNNLMSATHLLVTSEAILAGQRFGLDTEAMLAIFNASSGQSGSTTNKWPNFIASRTFNSGFALRLMLKDMRIAAKLAEQMESPSALAERALELWTAAAGELPEDADHTEIARWLEVKASPRN